MIIITVITITTMIFIIITITTQVRKKSRQDLLAKKEALDLDVASHNLNDNSVILMRIIMMVIMMTMMVMMMTMLISMCQATISMTTRYVS